MLSKTKGVGGTKYDMELYPKTGIVSHAIIARDHKFLVQFVCILEDMALHYPSWMEHNTRLENIERIGHLIDTVVCFHSILCG